jgi:4-hydroxyphenylpyruvate dioxygenase-like putative hemolysin
MLPINDDMRVVIDHVGVIVKDIDSTIELLTAICSLGPWNTYEFKPHKDEMAVGSPPHLKVAHAKLGSAIALELLQPLDEESYHAKALRANGEGVDHIAYSTSDYDAVVSELLERGGKMLVAGLFKGKHWCYIDSQPGGIVLDLLEGVSPWKDEETFKS